MNAMKLRRLLIQIHLYLAGFLAPAFLLVAISGGMDLAGFEAKTQQTKLELAGVDTLDFTSDTLKADIETILSDADINLNFEYVRARGTQAMTRPTSRTYVHFQKTADGVNATLNKPNLQYSLMELHKGHGPRIFRTYQIIAAIALFFVVIGGMAVGLLAKAYRTPTIISGVVGTLACVALAVL